MDELELLVVVVEEDGIKVDIEDDVEDDIEVVVEVGTVTVGVGVASARNDKDTLDNGYVAACIHT